MEVLLHRRPSVPSEPVLGLGSQKSGESMEYTKSNSEGGFTVESSGMRVPPSLPPVTFAEPLYCSIRREPISRNDGIFSQHVSSVHEPDNPWHLHSRRINRLMAWNKRYHRKLDWNQTTTESKFLFNIRDDPLQTTVNSFLLGSTHATQIVYLFIYVFKFVSLSPCVHVYCVSVGVPFYIFLSVDWTFRLGEKFKFLPQSCHLRIVDFNILPRLSFELRI